MQKIKREGLSTSEVLLKRKEYGYNELEVQKKETFFMKMVHVICEPMFLLLLVASFIYFLLGEPRDGIIMMIFVVFMIGIDLVQEWKTDKTLHALKDLSAPKITVYRDGEAKVIESRELVPGDLMLIKEGVKVPADGKIIECHDLCINESSLTGEAETVWKKVYEEENAQTGYFRNDKCYAGTLVTGGTGFVIVEKIGVKTEYGKIGKDVMEVPNLPTPLQKQTSKLVRTCAIIAFILLCLVCVFTWLNLANLPFTERLVQSILSGITLAMAMIPEEFPVVLTVFLSMGAWRLAKKQALIRKLPSVETLGAVSVLCVDKTGTLTKNEMEVKETFVYGEDEDTLFYTMGLACESETYDPMEKAMLSFCEKKGFSKETLFTGHLIREYSFTDALKMMGHIWEKEGEVTIACKGSFESILQISSLSLEEKEKINDEMIHLSSEGYRVIAVGRQIVTEKDIPEEITDCSLEFLGLIGLIDPPRETVREDIRRCHEAGIRVVMITGDNGYTAHSIAEKIGMHHKEEVVTGDMIEQMDDDTLCEKVKEVSLFSRVIPSHKMRIVKAFQKNGEVVAMTGDGVNDAPALKYADIGIAMGKRGSEVSREAADLILMDDNFGVIVDTVRDGRRIYDNIKKAINYIFTIHIPIALSSLLAPLLHIDPHYLFLLPIHVVLLELIIDPTCSIVLERQPADDDIMQKKPRKPSEALLTQKLIGKSLLQGIVIFAISFGSYYFLCPQSASLARSVGLTILIFANLFLVYVNSSTYEFALTTMKKMKKDKIMWLAMVGTIAMVGVILYTPLHTYLNLESLSGKYLFFSFISAFVSVFWYEIYKGIKHIQKRK